MSAETNRATTAGLVTTDLVTPGRVTADLVTPGLVTLPVKQLSADPHGIYRHYRPLVPFIAHDGGAYIVLRAKHVEMLLRDPRVQSPETELPRLLGFTEGAFYDAIDYNMLTSNGEVHRRRRAPLARTFAARLIADMRPRIRWLTEELIDGWCAGSRSTGGEVDFVARYAALVPARTISAMLDLPVEDIPYFTRLVYSISQAFGFTSTSAQLQQIELDTAALRDYIDALLKSRRGGGGDDFLSRYLAEVDKKAELSPLEVIMQILALIIGGTDTTRVALGILVALLLEQRDRWDAVCRDPALIPGAVAESLRYEPSVASMSRYTLEDIELDGHIMPAGQYVVLSTMSAMRDEQAHQRPDVFDMHRPDLRRTLMVFGGGPHRCLGEALAWAEMEEALATLTTRVPQLRLAGPMPRVHGFASIRRIDEMRVAWDRR